MIKHGRLWLLASALVVGSGAIFTGISEASAQADPTTDGHFLEPAPGTLFVIGRDDAIPVRVQLPASCVEQRVEIGLFHRNGPIVTGQVDGTTPVVARVTPSGIIEAQLPLPEAIPENLQPAWPGVSGDCLAEPLVSQQEGITFGLDDDAGNGEGSTTFIVPEAALAGPLGRVGTELAVIMNGVTCVTADLFANVARDGSGNLQIRVGGPDQPSECSIEGSEVTFTIDGRPLFERHTFLGGVMQPLANLAPEAPSTGPPPPPGAPNTGLARPAGSGDGHGLGLRLGLALLLLAFGAAATMLTRRR